MKSHVKAVVIGGGVVGCSVLYHLAKAGWTDVMLIERSELTSGSSWHAAGGFHTLNGDPNVAKLQAYTVGLYRELEEISGQSCGLHLTGGVMLADSPERMDFLRLAHAKGRCLGMDTEIITPSEAAAMFPLMDQSHFVGALWDPVEGHLDPSGTTIAYAKAAQKLGAEIVLRNRVVRADPGAGRHLERRHRARHGGGRARGQRRRPLGARGRAHGRARAAGAGDGAHVPADRADAGGRGVQRRPGARWSACSTSRARSTPGRSAAACCSAPTRRTAGRGRRKTPWDFGHELLQPDLDRIAPSLEVGFRHFPRLENAGIKQVINGPFTFAPDGNPLVGPVQGLTNFWVACGVMAGFSQGGGVGLVLANWMTNGDPGHDVFGMDVARFGEWATLALHQRQGAGELCAALLDPLPERGAGGGAAAADDAALRHHGRAQNAVMGVTWGLEVPLWFAPEGTSRGTCSRSTARTISSMWATRFARCASGVGVTEIANFAKYAVTGAGAEAWLNRLLTNRMPRTGRIALSPMLNEAGKLIGDFTVAKAGDETVPGLGVVGGADLSHALVRGAPAGGRLGRGSSAGACG